MDSPSHDARARLKSALESRAYVRGKDEPIVGRGDARARSSGWLFDIRRLLLEPDVAQDIAEIFWSTFPEKKATQIGGMESGAIPLVAGIVAHAHYKKNRSDVSGFFVRKSRKKDGLMRQIEGMLHKDRPLILVDDLINSAKSLVRQVELLESLGLSVEAIWTIVRFRDMDQYEYFAKKKIPIHSVFTLDDFSALGLKNIAAKDAIASPLSYRVLWKFAAPEPNHALVVPKSDPVVDDERLYTGSDSGVMWALDQRDGSVVWNYKIGLHAKGKGIFSSPALHAGNLYFGGYDGNIYCLDARTGKKKWVSFEADWVGSSPAIAADLKVLFIGLEYGLWRKRGGIAALSLETGKTFWAYRDMPCYTHSSPLYIQEHREVVIGSNDGAAYLFDAKSGTLRWKFESGKPTGDELDSGFSAHDIKESFVYDAKRDLIIFGNRAGKLCFVDRKNGALKSEFVAEFGFNSTPVLYENTVLASSLDKNLYCIDLDTFEERWRWNAGARIFATPVVIDGSIYIGANSGRLSEIDPANGKETSYLQLTERVTNKIAYNPKTSRFFVPTFANEMYCVEKKT